MKITWGLIVAALLCGCDSANLAAEDAWIQAAPPGSPMTAGYLRLSNRTGKTVQLTGVESPRFEHVSVHETRWSNGSARMVPRESLTLTPGQTLEFKPGGLHLMLGGFSGPLNTGEMVDLQFNFADGEFITVQARIKPL